MNYDIACEYLEINEEIVLTLEELKRKYRIKALMYHPDKNKSEDAVSKFQKIQSSYEYLLKYEGFTADDDYDDTDIEDDYSGHPKGKYLSLLFSFLKNVLREENLPRNSLPSPILHRSQSK
jgi:DnaJ-class molecular chaperone